MTRVLFAATLVLAISAPAFSRTVPENEDRGGGEQAATEGAAQQAALQTIRDYSAASHRNDAAAVDRLTTDDFLIVAQGGTVTKGDLLEDLAGGTLPPGTKTETLFEPAATSVRLYGDTAVVVSRATSREQDRIEVLEVPFRATYVLVKTQGSWRLASLQHMHDLPRFEDMVPFYTLTLQPAESARLEIDFEAGGENEVQVFDGQQKLIRTVNNRSTPEGQRSFELSPDKAATAPMTYTIRGRHKVGEPTTDPLWFESRIVKRSQPDGGLVLGFNDSWPDSDFNDARVKISLGPPRRAVK